MKKQILFIYGPLGGGGAERVLIDILRNFNYFDYDVDLCLIVATGILLPEVPNQVRIIPLWDRYTLYYKLAYRLSNWFAWNYLFKRILRQRLIKKYDVEISFLEGMPLKLHAMMDTKAIKVTWVHCDLFQFPYEAKQFRKGEELSAYNKMNKIVCVSADALTAFNKRFSACTSSRIVIYNPIDKQKIISMASAFPVKKEKFTIATMGRLTSPKRMDRILRLACSFKKEGLDVKFQIIGDGELKDALLLQRKKLDVEDMVEFLGFKHNPFPYIKRADLMFCCSGFEGFCLVICEAMCLGVPVVSTRTAGPIEILGENEYGILTDHDDESIYQNVRLLVLDNVLRKEYKERALKRAELFNVKDTLNRIYRLNK